MFTPESVRIVEQIGTMGKQVRELLFQRSHLKKNDVLKGSYTLAINSALKAVGRLSDKLATVSKEEGESDCSKEV